MKSRIVFATAQRALRTFLHSDSGAITVDWTVLSSAAISMALGTASLMRDHSAFVATGMNHELQGGDLSDGWPRYTFDHFEPVIAAGVLTTEEASALHDIAYESLNHRTVNHLMQGIIAMEAGTITAPELAELISYASVAYHRDLADEALLDYYFGFDGSTPYYMTMDQQQTATN